VKIDQVIFYPTDDDLAALKRHRAGELDTQHRWPLTGYKWLKANLPNETAIMGLRVFYTVINTRKPPLDDRRVRLAPVNRSTERLPRCFFNAYGCRLSPFCRRAS
jgi:ABC-type transport system substrate-binding protein